LIADRVSIKIEFQCGHEAIFEAAAHLVVLGLHRRGAVEDRKIAGWGGRSAS
jgi:hypothetical protein